MTDETNPWLSANCITVDPNVMQPEVATPQEVADAKAVCKGCPMFWQCQELAHSQEDPYGVHAGQWFGEQPAAPNAVACEHCGGPVEAATGDGEAGRPAKYCGRVCRDAAAYERRKAGRAEWAARVGKVSA